MQPLKVAILETVVAFGSSYLKSRKSPRPPYPESSKKIPGPQASPILKIHERSQVPIFRPPYPESSGNMPGPQASPILKIQERSQVPRPPYSENPARSQIFRPPDPENSSHVMYVFLSFVLSVDLSFLLYTHVFKYVVFPGVLHVCVVLSFSQFCISSQMSLVCLSVVCYSLCLFFLESLDSDLSFCL